METGPWKIARRGDVRRPRNAVNFTNNVAAIPVHALMADRAWYVTWLWDGDRGVRAHFTPHQKPDSYETRYKTGASI